MTTIETDKIILKQTTDHNEKEVQVLCEEIVNAMDRDIENNTSIIEIIAKVGKKEYDLEMAQQFIEKSSKKDKVFAIYSKEDEFLGIIAVDRINQYDKNANIGYWIKKNARGKGIMTNAVKEIQKFAFEELKLNKLQVHALARNKASLRVIEKTDFKLIGNNRKKVFRDGEYLDVLGYDLLREEFENS